MQHPDARGVVQGAIAGGVHWGRYTVNGRPQADIRFVVIADRQSDAQGTTGLRLFINAWNNLWPRYPALPYLLTPISGRSGCVPASSTRR